MNLLYLHQQRQGHVIVFSVGQVADTLLAGRQGFLLLTLWDSRPRKETFLDQEIQTKSWSIPRSCVRTSYSQDGLLLSPKVASCGCLHNEFQSMFATPACVPLAEFVDLWEAPQFCSD
jgi:hypothetical protein